MRELFAAEIRKFVSAFVIVAAWIVIIAVVVFNVIKTLMSTEQLQVTPIDVGVIIFGFVNAIAALGPHKLRRSVGLFWLIVAVLGFLALFVGAGLGIAGQERISGPCILGGLLMFLLYFQPDGES